MFIFLHFPTWSSWRKHLDVYDWSSQWTPVAVGLVPHSRSFTHSANVRSSLSVPRMQHQICVISFLWQSVYCICALCDNVRVPSLAPVPSGHEDHLIPYSVVQPVQVQTQRPVIFSPSLLSRGLIERLLQPAESGLKFNTCPPGTRTAHSLIHPHDTPNTVKLREQKDDSSFDHHMIHHSLLFTLFPVVCRAYPGFRETRQESVLVGLLQSRAGSGHTAAVNTGCHQPGNEKNTSLSFFPKRSYCFSSVCKLIVTPSYYWTAKGTNIPSILQGNVRRLFVGEINNQS